MSATAPARVRLQGAGRGLRGALAWWGAGLAAWLPPAWRRAFWASSDRLLLQADGDGLRLRRQGVDGLLELATLPWPPARADGGDPLAGVLREPALDLPRWLLLPATAGLRRALPLPAAAAARVRDVLGFEIERQTPFAAADVVHDGRVRGQRADGQLDAELVVVPRARLDAALAQAGPLAGWLAGVDLADADGRPLGVNLLPPVARRRQARPWRAWNLGLGALALAALVLMLGQVLANRRDAADRLQREVAARSVEARAASLQRQRLVDAVEGGAYLQAQRNGRASAVEVMDELARRLPDDTYLEKLSIGGGQLTLVGVSSGAAALVGKLEGARQWRAPALSGALQQDPRTRGDRFTLVAQLDVPAAEAPRAAR